MSSEFWKEFKRSDFSEIALVGDKLIPTLSAAASKAAVTTPTPTNFPSDGQMAGSGALILWFFLLSITILFLASAYKVFTKNSDKETKGDMEDGLIPSLGRHASIRRDKDEFDESIQSSSELTSKHGFSITSDVPRMV